MQSAETVLGVLRERGRRGLPLNELYRQLFNPQLYLLAYGRIYANKGAMTPGVTGETVDGMSIGKIEAIIEALRSERYRWSPVKRIHIPKKNGKTRPLGLPPWSDKLVGEVVRLLLDAYYEPTFSDLSHGFRPGRGCHTALRKVSETWTGTTWFIEGDVADCFGSFDHEIMLSTLAERIHDGRFLRLMRNMLMAGYLEDWVWNATLSGVPQGGVVSPILSNIYLHRLDDFVENVLIPHYTRGRIRRQDTAYARVRAARDRAHKRGDHATARELRKQLRSMPSGDPRDPGFRRLRYVRYCDDTLLGFTGPKAEAEEIKQRLTAFLRDELALELSADRTLITHARTQAARFLGYEIIVLRNDRKVTRGRRSANGVVSLKVPASVIKAKKTPYLSRGKPEGRPRLINEDDHTIVNTYGAVAGHRPVLPAGRERPSSPPARLGHGDLAAEDSGQQAPLVGGKDGPQIRGHHHHSARAAQVLRSQDRTQRQETTGRTVRRHPTTAQQGRGHHRPRPGPGHHPPQRADHPAPGEPVRDLQSRRRHLGAPRPTPRRPHPAGTATTRMGGTHGQTTAQNPRGLPDLP
jgi:group II intron reverse transcriptase/maturase